jgi:cysteinyl-tRNA synthetase
MMSLRLYDTLTRQKRVFTPLNPEKVGVYVCGPTVYDFAHMGNARPFVVFDVLVRVLRQFYPHVCYVRNITDVDDKINAAALKSGEDIRTLTQRTTAAFHQDMDAIGALRPDIEPRATEHIPEMVTMIQQLIDQKHAYVADGHVLFNVKSYSQYGELSRRNKDELLAGARVEVAPYKKDPGDFVLWKPSEPHLPGWDSPWGRGRPGWHIECSAMSSKYLGQTFDIHGGGIDLVFPHHENERAQSCCASGKDQFARYWLHNGHLTIDNEKMSKSLGNFFTVRDLLAHHPGEAIRFALLSTHYRQPLDWNETMLSQAQQTLDRFYGTLRDLPVTPTTQEIDSAVLGALCDDLNTPLAITRLHEIVSEIHRSTNTAEKQQLGSHLKASANLLGILQQDPRQWLQNLSTIDLTEAEINTHIQARQQARQEKNFQEADRLRKLLLDKGIVLEDSAHGTTWRRG